MPEGFRWYRIVSATHRPVQGGEFYDVEFVLVGPGEPVIEPTTHWYVIDAPTTSEVVGLDGVTIDPDNGRIIP